MSEPTPPDDKSALTPFRVGEDTPTGYRLRARDHITPHIGALPVKALTWQQVTLWIRELQNKGLRPGALDQPTDGAHAVRPARFRQVAGCVGYVLSTREPIDARTRHGGA